MFSRRWIVIPAILAGFSALLFRPSSSSTSGPRDYVPGRNNTALFIVAEHPGFSNVHLATTQSLLETYPEIEVHYASFSKLGRRLPRLVELVQSRQPKVKNIHFHELREGRSYIDAVSANENVEHTEDGTSTAVTPPGLPGMRRLCRDLQVYLAPWSAEEHLALHDEIQGIIDEVDPAVVVLDTIFSPGIEATRGKDRLHAFITPNTVADNFIAEQPRGQMLWKYPALSSGFPHPVPWRLIPLNIYLNANLIFSVLGMRDVKEKKKYLVQHGVVDPINFYGLHRPDAPWITQTTPGASVPLEVIPPNVTCTGPIVLSPARAEDQDPELVDWMRQKPTVLINLGSAFTYGIHQAQNVIEAVEEVLKLSDLQILWKLQMSLPVQDVFDWKHAVKHIEDTGRVRVVNWLNVEPASLLQSGHITAFVTHGGANGYHESIEAGVPQIVLPLWADLFNFAQLAEQIGVGLWACREISPGIGRECLSRAILRVADGNSESLAMRTTAKKISAETRARPGREIAAGIIAQLARSGVTA